MNTKGKVTDEGGHTDLRYNGRTLVVGLYVNTNEDAEQLLIRMSRYAKDTGVQPMVVGTIDEMTEEGAKDFWRNAIAMIRPTAKG